MVLTPSFSESAKDLYGNLSAMLHNPIIAVDTAGARIVALHDHVSITPTRPNPPVLERELTGIDIVQAIAPFSVRAARQRTLTSTLEGRIERWDSFTEAQAFN